MNIFGLDIESLDLDEAKAALAGNLFEGLPSVPVFLSRKEVATVLGCSMKIVNKLIEAGLLPLIRIPDDKAPVCFDLFDQPIEPPCIEVILRADLAVFLEKALLCHKPILSSENDL